MISGPTIGCSIRFTLSRSSSTAATRSARSSLRQGGWPSQGAPRTNPERSRSRTRRSSACSSRSTRPRATTTASRTTTTPSAPSASTGRRRTTRARTRPSGGATSRARRTAALFLFVRENKEAAYRALGPATEVHIEGDRPMSLHWKLEVPLPMELFRAFSVLGE